MSLLVQNCQPILKLSLWLGLQKGNCMDRIYTVYDRQRPSNEQSAGVEKKSLYHQAKNLISINGQLTGSTIRTLLHEKIYPKDWQVLPLGDVGFLQFFRVVSGDYGKPWLRFPGLVLWTLIFRTFFPIYFLEPLPAPKCQDINQCNDRPLVPNIYIGNWKIDRNILYTYWWATPFFW